MEDVSIFDLRSGQNIGGYTLIERLGGGAMGSVWRVHDDGGQFYAMKILRASMLEDQSEDLDSLENTNPQEQARLRLKREALALQKIHHEGVCSIVDMELDASIAFIVTELIDGHNLKEDVAINGPYVADDLERLAHKLIDAVKAVHNAGIIHRDIKPTNVMISTTGPVLVDFGISMGQGESHVTRTGLVMGTPGFIAPEIIEGSDSDEITDWWSVAAVLAFAATGKPVFGTKPIMAVLERAASGNANLNGLPINTMHAFRSALSPKRSERCTPEQLEQAIYQDALNSLSLQESNYPFDYTADGLTVPNQLTQTRIMPENPRKMWVSEDPKSSDFTTPVDTTLFNTTRFNTDSDDSTKIVDRQNFDQQDVDEQNNVYQDEQEYENKQEYAKNSEQGNIHPKISKYMFRGTFFLIIFAILSSSISVFSIIDALSANIILMLVTATIGYNVCAQLRRQSANDSTGGKDWLIRIGSIPWHFVRASIYTIPRLVTMIITGVIGAYIYPLMIHATPQLIKFKIWFITIHFPTYSPEVFSQTSIGYLIGFIAGWIIAFILGKTKIFRIGAGAILGAGKISNEQEI